LQRAIVNTRLFLTLESFLMFWNGWTVASINIMLVMVHSQDDLFSDHLNLSGKHPAVSQSLLRLYWYNNINHPHTGEW